MANRLKMAEARSIIALSRMGWSYRRIAAEVGVDRETVSRHVRAARDAMPASGDPTGANAASSMTGSEARRPAGQAPRRYTRLESSVEEALIETYLAGVRMRAVKAAVTATVPADLGLPGYSTLRTSISNGQ